MDRVRPHLTQALQEGWTARKMAEVANVTRTTAAKYLRDAAGQISAKAELGREEIVENGVAVARNIQRAQIATAGRIEALAERVLEDLEQKAGEGTLSARDLETLVKTRERHNLHIKELSGLGFAERLHLIQAKGEATGRGLASALDATALSLGNTITIEAELVDE